MTNLSLAQTPQYSNKTRALRSQTVLNTPTTIVKCRRDCSARSKSPNLSTAPPSTVLSRSGFEDSRQKLLRAISHYDRVQFLKLSTLVSCLLHSFRPLHQTEISRILRLLDSYGGHSDDQHESRSPPQTTGRELDSNFEDIVEIDSQGFMQFASAEIEQFLRSYQVKGIEQTHSTIARACIAQVASDQQLRSNASNDLIRQSTPFSIYAAQNWHKHYREVQATSTELSLQAHQILQTQISYRLNADSKEDFLRRQQIIRYSIRFCRETGLEVLLEKYVQLLYEPKGTLFPPYPYTGSQEQDIDNDVVVVSKQISQMNTSDNCKTDISDWVVVAEDSA